MKKRVHSEDGIELSTICRQFKMRATDGKNACYRYKFHNLQILMGLDFILNFYCCRCYSLYIFDLFELHIQFLLL